MSVKVTLFMPASRRDYTSAFKVTGEKVNALPLHNATKNQIWQSHLKLIAHPQAATKRSLASAWVWQRPSPCTRHPERTVSNHRFLDTTQ